MRHTDIKVNVAYRPDIDGLRCIAVMLVVLYHLFPKAIRGGFIGVDIFFVISGFLITSILYSDMQAGNYSILKFYGRRIRRIFPALIVVLAVTAAIGWLVLPPDELVSLGQTMIGGATFSANLVLLHQISYFDIAAENKPLLHLWSLGVEEQFYIAWPLILYASYKRKFNLLTLICAIMMGSFILNLAIVYERRDYAFYLPLTRAWELAVGAAMVFLRDIKIHPTLTRVMERGEQIITAMVWDLNRGPRQRVIAADIRASIGIVLIIIGAFSLTSRMPFPGTAALLPVIGAALLMSSPTAIFNRYVMSSKPFVFLGLISYPLYLWHYPLIAYARLTSEDAPSRLTLLGIAAASILLAWLTYRLIERPIRFGRFTSARAIQLSAAMASFAVAGYVSILYDGFPSRLPETIRSYISADLGGETSSQWRRGSCLLLPEQDFTKFGAECTDDQRRPMVVIWGDSYAAALYPGLKALQSDTNFGIAELTASACPPALGYFHSERPYCKGINDEVARKIAKKKPEIVILHSTWMYDLASLEPNLRQTVSSLRDSGVKRVIILGLVPMWRGRSLPQNFIDYYLNNSSHPIMPERTRYRLFPNEDRNKELEAIASRLNVEFISALKPMCNENGCLARLGDAPGDFTAYDTGHLTVAGSMFLTRAIKNQLLDSGSADLRR